MAPILSRLWAASSQFLWNADSQVPLQGAFGHTDVLKQCVNLTQTALSRPGSEDAGAFRGGPQIAGIDLVAMLVSDAGLASTEPVWWNTSPTGCLLLGLQPRGGWQVMQRTVQWGDDRLTKAFGVSCGKPGLFAYLTCSIRNRIEVWDSPRWTSPMQDTDQSTGWTTTGRCHVSRPTKLIDGSRGGQAFICEVLRPKDGQHYGIEQQARMQLLSVLLVAAGLMDFQSVDAFKTLLVEDFALTVRLSPIFRRLRGIVVLANTLVLLALCSIAYHFWAHSILGGGTPYVVEITSIASWAVGAIALLMQGGNPRVALFDCPMPTHVQERYNALLRGHQHENQSSGAQCPKDDEAATVEKIENVSAIDPPWPKLDDLLKVEFGSLHGSVFIKDKGHCMIPAELLRFVCSNTVQLQRPWRWYTSVLWSAMFLVISIVLQIVHTHVASIGSVVVGVVVLLGTSVLRGTGISGPEEWQIPVWKQRRGVGYGAALQGAVSSR